MRGVQHGWTRQRIVWAMVWGMVCTLGLAAGLHAVAAPAGSSLGTMPPVAAKGTGGGLPAGLASAPAKVVGAVCSAMTAPCQPVAGMTVSANYLNNLLPTFEGDIHQYYNDSQCNCTAGVGHLIQHGQCPASLAAPAKQKTPQATNACVKNTAWNSPNAFPGAPVTTSQIIAWEKTDIGLAARKAKLVLSGKSVTQTEFDAVVDLIYNGGLYPSYHIANYIYAGNFGAAIKENIRRGQNNGLPQNRVNFENSGLAEGNSCK